MAHKQKLPRGRVHQSTVEWTYPKAHRYWDDSGKLISAVEAAFPGLECKQLAQNGFRFEGGNHGISLATFYWNTASVTQAAQGNERLGTAAARFWEIVREHACLTNVTRYGHRSWLIFDTDNLKEAVRWLEGLNAWRFGDAQGIEALGTPVTTGLVMRTRLATPPRDVRLELNAGSVSVKSKESWGVLVDVDLAVEAPPPTSDFGAMVEEDARFLRESVDAFVRGK